MRKVILLGLMFFVMFAAGCTSVQDDQFLSAVPYPDSTEILYKQEIDEGILYFYKDETGFRHSLVSYDGNVYVNSDALELNPKMGADWSINEDPHLNIMILAGVISNEKIQTISIKQNRFEHLGVIVEPKKGPKVWFAMFEKSFMGGYNLRKEHIQINHLRWRDYPIRAKYCGKTKCLSNRRKHQEWENTH